MTSLVKVGNTSQTFGILARAQGRNCLKNNFENRHRWRTGLFEDFLSVTRALSAPPTRD